MKKTINISLNLLTHNEAENLQKNFDWVKKCKTIKEIIIIDDNSTDETIKIAKTIGSKIQPVKIFSRGLSNDFSAQRNFAVSKSKYDWILWLDADERPSKKLSLFLNHIDKLRYKNYSFKRVDTFLGQKLKYGETAYLDFVRLFNKNYGRFIGKVHETWESPKKIKETEFVIKHNSHETLKSFIEKINFYTDIRAQEMFKEKENNNLFQIIFYPIGKFFQNYIFRLGFLDGTAGIIMALSMSFHVFLNKSKLWHLYQK